MLCEFMRLSVLAKVILSWEGASVLTMELTFNNIIYCNKIT